MPHLSLSFLGGEVSLQDSLAARLDFLGPAKETAQWAAACGREFYLPVLQACAPYKRQRLQRDLACLIEAELIVPVQVSVQDLTPFLSAAQMAARPAGDPVRATLLARAAQALLISLEVALKPEASLVAAARAELRDDRFQAAWVEGETMPLEQAIALALAPEVE